MIDPMIVDGKKIAQDIFDSLKEKIREKKDVIKTSVFIVGNNPATESFVRIKKRKAEEVGIELNEIRFDENIDEGKLIGVIKEEGEIGNTIVVQLPLPKGMNKDKVLNAIPSHLDVDVLSEESNLLFEKGELSILPPVVGAIKEILEQEKINIEGKKVVIVGRGALVGKPASVWFKSIKDVEVVVLGSSTEDLKESTIDADIILTGAGVPSLITSDMIKEGVILLDAGTSEEAGVLKGDISKECADKASVFTPVPGGIGPITVAVLLRNIIKESNV